MVAGRGRGLLLVPLLALAPAAAYAPAWASGRLLAPGPAKALHLPLRVEAWRALGRAEVPSWNPSSFSGTPLLADYRAGALHPLTLATTPLPPAVGFQVLVLLSLGLAGTLAFACALRLGAEPAGALVAGLGFALGPYLVAHLGDTATVVAAPALPLLLLAAEVHLDRPRARSAVLVATAVALLVLAGSEDAVGAGALVLAVRLAFGPAGSSRTSAGAGRGSLVAAVAAGVLLAAPQLLPTALAVGEAGTSVATSPPAPVLAGVAGLVVRYVSHTPAPLFALAAVPLLAAQPPLRVLATTVALAGVPFALRPRPELPGALPLAFDLSLALLGGLSLSVQIQERTRTRGRRLRLLTTVAAVCAAAALSVATTVTGPLAPELAAPVGLLALSLILYVLHGDSRHAVTARVFLLPLVASFLLQPFGRDAWAGAPTWSSLVDGTTTRRAIDRVMGPRSGELTLSLVTAPPRGRADDLAWANLAAFAGRTNANGDDPLVPASRREALGGMRTDGTLPPSFLQGDPGRLELLGVRWVQAPTAALTVAADPHGLGDDLDVVVEPGRPRLLALPFTLATEVRIASFLAGATLVRQGEVVAECVARLATGREIWLPIRAGVDTAEWAWERPDVRARVRHERARVLQSFATPQGFEGHQYLGVLRLPGRFTVLSLRVRGMPGAPPLWLLRAGLRDAETGQGRGVSLVSGYLSEEARLAEAADTPLVTLFQVRRGISPARVVESVRVLPDAHAVADALASPTRLGVDSSREALADAGDVGRLVLPPGSRSSPAVLARARGGRLVVQASGPGLLVVGRGWDRGWRARVDDARAEALRVNGDRIGIVLEAGTHRVVLHHRAPGFAPGLALAAIAALALGAAWVAEGRRRRAV
jgi:hypothetical protein